MAKLKPITTPSLVDKVETSLREFIKENELKAGDSLPREIEIAGSLNVSRTVVREALLRLRTFGIITSKKHQGMTISHPDIVNGLEQLLDPLFLSEETLKDMFELRLILELGMGEMIFERKTQEDLDELQEIVEAEEQSGNDSRRFSLKQEIAFHGKLYEMSGNQTLQKFQGLLLPVFQYVHDKGYFNRDFQYSKKNVRHQDIYLTLISGSPDTLERQYDSTLNLTSTMYSIQSRLAQD